MYVVWGSTVPSRNLTAPHNPLSTSPPFAFSRRGSPNTIPPSARADISSGSVLPRRSRCSLASPAPPRMSSGPAVHGDRHSSHPRLLRSRRLRRMRIRARTHRRLQPRHLSSCSQVLPVRECCVPLRRRCATFPRSVSLRVGLRPDKHSGPARSCPLVAFAATLRVPQTPAIAVWRPTTVAPCQIRSRISRMVPSFALLLSPAHPVWSIQWSGFLPRNKKAPSDTPRAARRVHWWPFAATYHIPAAPARYFPSERRCLPSRSAMKYSSGLFSERPNSVVAPLYRHPPCARPQPANLADLPAAVERLRNGATSPAPFEDSVTCLGCSCTPANS